MTRLLTILILLLAGIPQLGIGLLSGSDKHQSCANSACYQMVAEQSCCELMQSATAKPVCPMTGGQCRCISAPVDSPPQAPEAPLPPTGSKLILGLAARSLNIPISTEAQTPASRIRAGQVAALASLRTHNETQALLGIWRT